VEAVTGEPIPREIITYPPGAHTFVPSDYPWLVHVRAFVKSGGAGGSEGDGDDGIVILELYDREAPVREGPAPDPTPPARR
jgi:hypothetical protein